jgi:hypothetical protein
MILRNIRTAVRTKDGKLLVQTLKEAELSGLTEQQCFRIGLGVDDSLTKNEWADLKLNGTDA